MNNSPIIVSGVPRSGGGIIAQILDKAGIYSGGVDKTNSFENTQLQTKVVHPYFKSIDVDEKGQYPLPNSSYAQPIKWDLFVEHAIKKTNGRNWFVKDSKAILIWKVWQHVYPNTKWIIVRRRTGDIVNSCLHTDYMNAFNSEKVRRIIGVATISQGWKWWVHRYEERILELLEKGNIKIVYPERIINGDYSQLYDVLNWANVEVTDDLKKYVQTFTK